jgi:tetratricopeptide (TPR) repeat protein
MAEMFRESGAPRAADLVKLNTLLGREKAAETFVARVRAWYPPEDFGSRRRVLFARTLRLLGARLEAGLCLKSVTRPELDEEHRGLLSRERLNLLQADFDDRFAVLAQRIVNEGAAEGADLLDFAIEEEPSFWPARFLKGLVLSHRGLYEDSIAELELVLQLQPKNDVVWYTRGLQLVRLGRDAEAVRCFESAIELNSKETDYHSNLALTQARLKNAEAARAALERVRALRPDHPENERLESSIDETL